MTKKEHIQYWLSTANEDYEVFLTLYQNKKYLQALFFAHLVLEKLIKAHWVKDNRESIPPKVHNLVYLVKQTKLELNNDDLDFLALFNDFQIQGRYPDYQQLIYKTITKDFVDSLLQKYNEIRQCLLKMIA
ncbi:MAG: hypothetical protein QG635_1475 [Bacteroidota bacterium]|nr:hypothetical protein [Bacteroidota bacterium]